MFQRGNGGIVTADPHGSMPRDVTWVRAFALDTARNRVEIFPGIPGGWDFIGLLDTNNTDDEITIHFPEKISDGVRLIKGRAVRLIKGVTLEKFFLTNTARSGGSVTLFVGGEGGAEMVGGQSVEVVGSVTVQMVRTATAVDGVVSVLSASSTQIRPANTSRHSLALRNLGANRIWIGVGTVVINEGIYVDPAEMLTFHRGVDGYTGAVNGIAATGNTDMGFLEIG